MTAGPVTSRSRADRPASTSRQQRRRWPWVLALVLVLGLAGGAYYVVRWTSVLGLQQVTVAGVADALADEVGAAVDVPLGTPLIAVDTGAVAAEVAATVPAVDEVTVVRQWPNELLVSAVARAPVAVTAANGTWWLLDKPGVPYGKVAKPPENLLAVELATPGPADPSTTAAIAVIGTLPAAIAKKIDTVVAPSPYRISLVLTDGRTVIWGDPSRDRAKAAVLPALLEQPGSVYDVSDPTLATVTG